MRKKPLKQFLAIFVLLVIGSLPVCSQNIVKGLVVDNEGTPLPGVTVVVKGKEAQGTVTSIEGRYALNAESRDTLTFSYIGFATKKEYVGKRTEIDVVMKEDENTLDEMVHQSCRVAYAKHQPDEHNGRPYSRCGVVSAYRRAW